VKKIKRISLCDVIADADAADELPITLFQTNI
jgi:hypothetical protein